MLFVINEICSLLQYLEMSSNISSQQPEMSMETDLWSENILFIFTYCPRDNMKYFRTQHGINLKPLQLLPFFPRPISIDICCYEVPSLLAKYQKEPTHERTWALQKRILFSSKHTHKYSRHIRYLKLNINADKGTHTCKNSFGGWRNDIVEWILTNNYSPKQRTTVRSCCTL